MLPDDGESVGLVTNRLPLAVGTTAEGLYPGVSEGGMDGLSGGGSWDAG